MDLYYTVLSAPCQSVYLVAKYLGIDLNLKYINVREYMKTCHSKSAGFSYSRAIMTYLVNKYAPENPIYPVDFQQRATVERLMYYDMGTLFYSIGEYFKPQFFNNESPDRQKEEKMREAVGYIESLLSKTNYVAGDTLTIADMCIGVSVALIQECDYDFADFPKTLDYIRRLVEELPFYSELKAEWKVELKMYLDSRVAREMEPTCASTSNICSMLCKKGD